VSELETIEPGKWLPIYLKLEEARLFLNHLETHKRFPKLVLFYLSAFLSASRSVTFHVQKQIVPSFENGMEKYTEVREKYLNNEVAKYFVELRNISEKQMFLPLGFEMMEKHPNEENGEFIYTRRAASAPSTPSKHHLDWLENVLNTEWSSYTQPRWLITDFPTGKKELFEACEEYLASLQMSVEVLRRSFDP